jgi:quinoprotein glucose dehydrogenase
LNKAVEQNKYQYREGDPPPAGFATPSVYSLGGREYVVIACGGGKLYKHSGDSYVAFALPE